MYIDASKLSKESEIATGFQKEGKIAPKRILYPIYDAQLQKPGIMSLGQL